MAIIRMENFNCIQVYSVNNDVNLLVDKIWVNNDRVYFRVLEKLQHSQNRLRQEKDPKVYSIPSESFYSIRCRLYF